MRKARVFIVLAVLVVAGLFTQRGAVTGFLTKNVNEDSGYRAVDFPVKYENTLTGTVVEGGNAYSAVAELVIEMAPIPSSAERSFDKVSPSGTTSYFLASWDSWGPRVKGTVTFNGNKYPVDSAGSSSGFSAMKDGDTFSYVFTGNGITLQKLHGVTMLELEGSNTLRGSDGLTRLNGNEKVRFRINGPVKIELEG